VVPLKKPITILMADDDEDDRLMTKEALIEAKQLNEFRTVEDGEELMEYLKRIGRYSNPKSAPTPGLILLDLNMPKKDGREVLKEIKANPVFRHIPVVVLTTSKAEDDILRTYELGVNSFVVKPATFEQLVDVMKMLTKYWFGVVELPQ
jgi:CheY-like chemotaxis protein